MWNKNLTNILERYLLILCFLLKYIHTYQYQDSDPNWKYILNKLRNKVDDIYSGNYGVKRKHEEAYSGKFFKYVIPKTDENDDDYEAFEEGVGTLPKWLSFEAKKRKLHGVPTDEDIRTGIKIVFRRRHENTVNGVIGESKSTIINVYVNPQPFTCDERHKNIKKNQPPTNPYSLLTTGSIIFMANISNTDGRKRVKLLRNIAQQLDEPIHSIYLELGNRLSNDKALENGIRMAGPGDRVTVRDPGFTITWKIKCDRDIAGDKNVKFLGQLSAKEDFISTFKEPVLGWFVHTSEDQPFRVRRALGRPYRTPVSTPTPTISPSPSVVRATVSPVQISPTSAVVVTKTRVATTQPVTTPPPTTLLTTQIPTTQKITTEKLTTTLKITTKPTTTETPTTKPPTENPTTKPATEEITETITGEDKGPTVRQKIGRITLFAHEAREVRLQNLFHSKNPLTTELKYRTKDGFKSFPGGKWIEYKNENLYLLPIKKDIGNHMFSLTGTDQETQKYVNDIFEVEVKNDNTLYNNLFNVTVDKEYDDVIASPSMKVKLIQNIASATNKEYGKLRAIQFYSGSVIIEWGLADTQYTSCRNRQVNDYMKDLQSDEFRSKFNIAGVLATGMLEVNPCIPPVVVVEKSTGESDLWQRILIPVIVIVVLLLIIALILCCVYRRKRKASVQIEEDKAYLNHKKPVIFLEEFEEKPHFVSLQPLILPNEKPPTPGNHYEPRADTPDGPGSSTTVSTESEEKPLTPQSPKESSRKGYNAPPPYNSL